MSIFKNYLSTILLLLGIIIGGIFGLIFGPETSIVKPIGDIFLNLIFMLVVPLVFFSIATSMCNLKQNNMVGKVLGITAAVFVVMSFIVGISTYSFFAITNPFESLAENAANTLNFNTNVSLGDTIVSTLTTNDFSKLLSKSNLLPLIIFSSIFGIATASIGKKGQVLADLLDSGLSVIMRMMSLIMLFAPIGLGCYFADMIGQLGISIAGDYVTMFVYNAILAFIFFGVIHTIYIMLVRGNVKDYWKNMMTPSLTAIATCSSAACIPINIEAMKKMGVNSGIAESIIPLGTNLHKDGSVMAAVIKIIFALAFIGQFEPSITVAIGITLLAIVVSTVVGAVPVGGMTAEILICSILGIDPEFAAVLLVIGTITDIPATLLNSTANVTGTYIVDKILSKRSNK